MENDGLSSREIKSEELNILRTISKFCDTNNLRYSLAGGTLLGAVRHKGFIPWDDDIDIMMPRPDYEKFLSSFSKRNDSLANIRIVSIPEQSNSQLFSKVVNTDIIVDEPYVDRLENLWVDVLPVDGLPDSYLKSRIVYLIARLLRRVFSLGQSDMNRGNNKLRIVLKRIIVPLIRNLHFDRFCAKLLRRLSLHTPYESTDYIGIVTWGLYGIGERIRVNAFQNVVNLEFAGSRFKSISSWNEYLHGIYGDYMQLPAKDKRVSHGLKAKRNFD